MGDDEARDEKQEFSIHDRDPGPLEEPRSPAQVEAEILADPNLNLVRPGSDDHERGAGVRSAAGGDDAVADDTP
jgi:hypothetical protein